MRTLGYWSTLPLNRKPLYGTRVEVDNDNLLAIFGFEHHVGITDIVMDKIEGMKMFESCLDLMTTAVDIDLMLRVSRSMSSCAYFSKQSPVILPSFTTHP
ncbi:hypothetical protein N7520_011872 [Penicillium odoratum]|uniref:uncharacterized protein n=1 Tax=Penicillium odoratum TaxID=1167516 RepID=UPI002547B2EE|nr:uncharacterized protein N7520_011872 [Penicillium odoratum]KAJ5746690.1 hypothetical protein N7520_011872 [Penicillium odoratum]